MQLSTRHAGILLLIVLGSLAAADATLIITSANRQVALLSQVVYVTDKLTFKITGSQPESTVTLCDLVDHAQHLAVVQVNEKGAPNPLPVLPSEVDVPENVTCFEATLSKPLAPGSSVNIEYTAAYTHLLTPYPTTIKQDEPQRVLFHGSAHVISPYVAESETTTFKLASRKVESFTAVQPSSHTQDRVKYGPYKGVAPFTVEPIRLHFESNTPFAVVSSLVREVEISHWGNIYVEETYTLKHAGARHKGIWSRLDFQLNPVAFGSAAFRQMVANLPPEANTIYFKDEIGNISTSRVRRDLDKVEVLLEPRYPLFGGWQVNFVFGYSLPLRSFVSRTPEGARRLMQPFGCPISGLVVDDFTIKVVLPEGSTQIDAQVPFNVDMHHETKHTYLDTVGRPVVVLQRRNVVDQHNQPFYVNYRFSSLTLLREPLLLVTVFAILFASAVVYVRCDFHISRDAKWVQEQQQLKAQGMLETLATTLAERRKVMHALDAAASDGTASQQAENSLKASFEQVKSTLKSLEDALAAAPAKMSAVNELLEKERALQSAAISLSSQKASHARQGIKGKELDKKVAVADKQVEDLKKSISLLVEGLFS